MIWFRIAAALISAAAASLVVFRAARGARLAPANPELAVYRRQMAELDELAERGLIAEGEKRSVRAETGRRLLAAAERPQQPLSASRPALVLAAAALVPLAAVGAYLAVGRPAQSDQPFAQRLKSWEQTAASNPEALDAPQLAAVWRAIAAKNPNDPEPLRQLAVAELAAQQPTEALEALHRATRIAPDHADLWEMLGELDVAGSQGDVGAEALDAFRRALAIDPTSATARYYIARARIAGGDVAGGLADWRAIEAGLKPDDPNKTSLAAEIAQVSTTGKLAAEAPPAPAAEGPQGPVGGPQIQAMVDGLAARLKAQPDDPDGWVRLVRAYSVLGETDRRDAALAEARQRFASRKDVLDALDAAAKPPAP